MVYHGRPSKDCLPCRRRKLRCDLDPSGCSQCRRAKLACHGYRDLKDLAFRDETRSVTKKAMLRHNLVTLTAVPQPDWTSLSRDAFLSLYIDRYSRGFDALGPLLTTSPSSGYLYASVDAVSLAFMAYQVNHPDLITQAKSRYLAAIRSLRTAIPHSDHPANDSRSSISNAFLQSVLLLDLYEKIDRHRYDTSPNFPSSWLSHVFGALAMIRERPSTEFSDPIIRELASRTVFALTISCDLAFHVNTPKWAFINLLSAIVNLRADIRAATCNSDAILLRAQELNKRLALAESKIPSSWKPHKKNSDSSMAFGGYYDHYPDHFATQVFNAFRLMRLNMNSIVQGISPRRSTAEEIVNVTQDICASIPQLQCYGTLTPLYAAAQITTAPHTRNWILQTLTYMADNGVEMARQVHHILTSAPETDYWVVFAMLGSCGITA
ncbi:hypothetical protein IQ07DRAFT_660453 [Pyrenochaeta sp. DS3sAY3a]|nr:hypothetical protein IQ07DRAFT_660453 [Pyrenochaeta sp. DS3sAY3a]